MAESSDKSVAIDEDISVDKSGVKCVGNDIDVKTNHSNDVNNSDDNKTIAIGRKISVKSNRSTKSNDHQNKPNVRNRFAIERSNFVNLMKLIVKELIEKSAKTNRIVESNNISLKHLFVVLEQIFKHGLKSKKGLFESKREMWSVIELVERLSSDAYDITVSARQIPTIKTPLGKVRAWLRLALMNKKLSDYFRLLLENREIILSDYYEEWAIMMSDEAIIIGGLLVGLNILDCNLCVKEENLDSDDNIIDLSLYLRDNIQTDLFDPEWRQNSDGGNNECNGFDDNMSVVLDQKNYIEELNRHMSSTITNLEHKIESLQTDNTLMSEELEIFRKLDKSFEIIKTLPEMDSLKQSKEEFSQLEEQLKQEVKRRETAEKELESMTFLKGESETAMHLLERDVLEKQDSVVTLRRQLEDIKTINLQMYSKLQECETSIKNKCNHISHLEQNISVMANTITQLESKLSNYEKQRQNDEENQLKLNEQLTDVERQRITSERDAKTEKEWRTTLQKLIDEQQEQITSLQQKLEFMRQMNNESLKIQNENQILKKKCMEYELSLEEIGKQLQDSKLEVDDLKENSGRLKEAVWTSDRDAVECHQCSKQFSVARRRHHCRSCGEIFCSNCSNNEMPLPSNKKPVRVCDSCHAYLLERYSAT